MSQYLQDENLKNLTIDEQAAIKLNQEFLEIAHKHNEELKKRFAEDTEDYKKRALILSYIIRFDGKGFRLFDFSSALKHFQDAHRVERFLFILDSIESINRVVGKSAEISFDAQDMSKCLIRVQDDNPDWVDLTFIKLKERLNKFCNHHYLVQNRIVPLLVQLLGIAAGIFLSLWFAVKLSPNLLIDSAFAFSFIISLILYSNCWEFIKEQIFRILNYYWPNISFKEKRGAHWLVQAIISTALIGFAIVAFNKLFGVALSWVKSLVK